MDTRPFSSRFDKSVEGILNGRNAAMFVAIEAKKRGWNLEFEEVQYYMIRTFSIPVHI